MKYLIEIWRLRIHHSCLWQHDSPYEACSASYMALATSVHIATHFGQGISCSRKKLSITLKISELFLPPGSCLQNRNSSCISFWSTNHKKAKSWASFNTSVDLSNCSAKQSAFGSFATSSALTSAGNSSIGRALGFFSVFYVLILPKHCFAHITSCWQY